MQAGWANDTLCFLLGIAPLPRDKIFVGTPKSERRIDGKMMQRRAWNFHSPKVSIWIEKITKKLETNPGGAEEMGGVGNCYVKD